MKVKYLNKHRANVSDGDVQGAANVVIDSIMLV